MSGGIIARICLIIDQSENRQLLNAWLSAYHSVVELGPGESIDEPFDLCIIDGPSLEGHLSALQNRRESEQPGFVPVILITRRRAVWAAMHQLWQVVDDVIPIPAGKLEFQARIEILLRARRMSLELRLRNEDLEAFIQAMSHDLRASIRAVTMFTESLTESQQKRLDDQGRQDLERIRWVSQEMRELIDSLLNFTRLGRGEVRYQPIDIRTYIENCLRNLQAEIRTRNAEIEIKGRSRTVQADPTLLKIALTNLLSNAIKFVPEGRRPQITISVTGHRDLCRIEVDDNGVGISKEDLQRIFMPFVRLYSEEQFHGIGLGLPSVRKAVELMGGRVGVDSEPDRGSCFWIEFAA